MIRVPPIGRAADFAGPLLKSTPGTCEYAEQPSQIWPTCSDEETGPTCRRCTGYPPRALLQVTPTPPTWTRNEAHLRGPHVAAQRSQAESRSPNHYPTRRPRTTPSALTGDNRMLHGGCGATNRWIKHQHHDSKPRCKNRGPFIWQLGLLMGNVLSWSVPMSKPNPRERDRPIVPAHDRS